MNILKFFFTVAFLITTPSFAMVISHNSQYYRFPEINLPDDPNIDVICDKGYYVAKYNGKDVTPSSVFVLIYNAFVQFGFQHKLFCWDANDDSVNYTNLHILFNGSTNDKITQCYDIINTENIAANDLFNNNGEVMHNGYHNVALLLLAGIQPSLVTCAKCPNNGTTKQATKYNKQFNPPAITDSQYINYIQNNLSWTSFHTIADCYQQGESYTDDKGTYLYNTVEPCYYSGE